MFPVMNAMTFLSLASLSFSISVFGGTWTDHFTESSLGPEWQGTRNFFSITNGMLKGVSVSPVAPAPFNYVEVGKNWDDYVVECRINVVMPNLLVCSKGALLLRHNGNEGYVFAIHTATKKIEVYRLSNEEMLLSKDAPLEFQQWHYVRAELKGPSMTFYVDGELIGTVVDARSPSGAVGLVAQDVGEDLFDDFSVRGPNIPSNGMEVSKSQQGLVLAWPAALTNYNLQTTARLAANAAWARVTNGTTPSGDRTSTIVVPEGSAGFYRLGTK